MAEENFRINILFTSAGRRSYLIEYFKRALGNEGKVYAANSNALSTALEVADERVITPLIYSKDYIPFLLDFCRSNHIDMIIPLFDIDLPILSRYKKEFEKIGTFVLVSDLHLIEICNDKWKTHLFLRDNKFDAIPTFMSADSVLAAIKKGEVSYPLIVKPRWGMGSIAIYRIENENELRILYQKVKRDISNTYLKYNTESDAESSVIIQPYIEGQEYGMDVICDLNGEYITSVIRKKISMRSGETDCAEMVDDHDLKNLAQKMSNITKHIGIMDMDVIRKDGKMYILEMNARFGGGYPFSHVAGVDLPKAIVKWLKQEKVEDTLFDYDIGVIAQKSIGIMKLSGTE